MADAAIAVNNLTFKYGGLKVIDDMSLEIQAGTSYGLLGPNGAGKTTLIRLMVGLLKPASGSVKCLGKAPSTANARLIGYMPQLPALYPELSVAQNIDFFAHIYGMKNRKKRAQRVDEVIKVVDLWPKRQYPDTEAFRRDEAARQPGLRHRPPATADFPRRTDGRTRPGAAGTFLELLREPDPLRRDTRYFQPYLR